MKNLIITAGHHRKDSGAIGNGYMENAVTIEIRDLIVQRIHELVPEIVIWQDDDDLTLSEVIAKVKSFATAESIWVEYHFDAAISPKVSGATSLVADRARQGSRVLAKELVEIGSIILGIPNRGVKSEKDSNRGRLGMLHTIASSVLFELCFISNEMDIGSYQKWKYWLAEEHALLLIKAIKE